MSESLPWINDFLVSDGPEVWHSLSCARFQISGIRTPVEAKWYQGAESDPVWNSRSVSRFSSSHACTSVVRVEVAMSDLAENQQRSCWKRSEIEYRHVGGIQCHFRRKSGRPDHHRRISYASLDKLGSSCTFSVFCAGHSSRSRLSRMVRCHHLR